MRPRWLSVLSVLVPWLIPASLLVGLQVAASAGWMSNRIFPAPIEVLQTAWGLSVSGELPNHLVVSTVRALTGFLIGGGLGFVLGLAAGTSIWAEKLFDGSVQMVRTIPHLALVPLVILWFGIGESAKIFLVALGVLFPVYVNTYHGIRTVDAGLVEMGRMYGIGANRLFWEVLLPGALPSILVGVRLALGVMWLTLIVAETIAVTSGIGYLAMNAREFFQTDVVVVCILVYAGLGKLADTIVRYLERWLLTWHPAFAAPEPGKLA